MNSYEIFYHRTRKGWPFNTGDCLIEVTTWAGLTVHIFVSSLVEFDRSGVKSVWRVCEVEVEWEYSDHSEIWIEWETSKLWEQNANRVWIESSGIIVEEE